MIMEQSEVHGRKVCTVPLCPPLMLQGLPGDQTWTSTVKSWKPACRAMFSLALVFLLFDHGINICNINAPEVVVCYMICYMMCNSTDRQRVGSSYKILRYNFWHISVTFTSVFKFIVCMNVHGSR